MLRIIGTQWSNILLRISSALALTPFLISQVGAEGYGVWLFLNAIVGYLSILQSGLPAASLRHLSEQLKEDDYSKFNRTLASSLALFAGVAAVVVLAGITFIWATYFGYGLDEVWAEDGRWAFLFATLTAATTLLSNPIMTVLEAHGRYVNRNLIEMVGTIARTLITILLVLWKPTITSIGIGAFIAEIVIVIGLVAHVRRHLPAVHLTLKGANKETVSSLFNFSVVVLLLAMGARLSYHTDALVIGFFMPMAAVSIYSVGNTLVLYMSRLVNGIAEPLMPRATLMRREQKETELLDMYLKWSKVAMSAALLIGMFLIFLGSDFIALWINPEFGDSVDSVLAIIAASFVILLPASSVGFRIMMGISKPLALANANLVAGVANLLLSLLLVQKFGLIGVALGTAIPNILLAAYLNVLACRTVGVGITRYFRYVYSKPILCSVPPGVALLYFEHALPVQSMLGLAVSGFLYLIIFAGCWSLLAYRNDPYFDFAGWLRHRLLR